VELLALAFVWVALSLPIQLCYRARKTEALSTVHGCYNRTGRIARGCAI
jgi:hypothetical protein